MTLHASPEPGEFGTNTTAIMSLTNCRFYEEKYPEVESFVMVNVKQVCGVLQRLRPSHGTSNN